MYLQRSPIEQGECHIGSAIHLKELVAQELDRGISSNHILLAGFSQGGAIALHAGLQYDKPLLGILALSAYLPVPRRIQTGANSANQSTPIFMGHGTHDPVVPMELGRQSCDRLIEQGYSVEWHAYPMQHSVNMDEIRDVGAWMTSLL